MSQFSEKRLLLMDDDQMLRKVIGRIMLSLGIDISYAETGEEAIDLYKQALLINRPYDLLLLDLSNPHGMGAEQTIQQIRKMDNRVKAVVTSGYSEDSVMKNYRKYGFIASLSKPFDVEQLKKLLKDNL